MILEQPTGYAEKILDCPEWVQAKFALFYRTGGIKEQSIADAFESGNIAIEWHSSESGIWWRFCERKPQ